MSSKCFLLFSFTDHTGVRTSCLSHKPWGGVGAGKYIPPPPNFLK
jgi:hypothetical protein